MYLVSTPERRLLVRSTSDDNHETTLVVPLLGVPRVEYQRCLVDSGERFEEHAVVRLESDGASASFRVIVEAALSAARPTVVSFLLLEAGSHPRVERSDSSKARGPGVAASAVCLLSADLLLEPREALGFSIASERGVFVCTSLSDAS